MLPLFIFKELW